MSAYICLNCGSVASKRARLIHPQNSCINKEYIRYIPENRILEIQKKLDTHSLFLVKVVGEVYEGNLDEPFGSINLQDMMHNLIPYTVGYRYLWPMEAPIIFIKVIERVRDGEEFGGEIAYNYQIIFLTRVPVIGNIHMGYFLHRIMQDNNGNEFDGIDENYTVEVSEWNELLNFALELSARKEWPFINWATNPLDVEEQVVKPKKKKNKKKQAWDYLGEWGPYEDIFKDRWLRGDS